MSDSTDHSPPLCGLVLAGGRSSRMGADKGRLPYDGVPAVVRAFNLLAQSCQETYVSVRPDQAESAVYMHLPLIRDAVDLEGPIAGLLSAWKGHPDSAWLVLAADMPLVDGGLLGELVAARDPTCLATAFRNLVGIPEPLCAIWEPSAAETLARRVAEGRRSLREALVRHGAKLIPCAIPDRLRSIDTPEDRARFAREP